MTTVCAEGYVPAAGLKAGAKAGGVIVYVAELTPLVNSWATFWPCDMLFEASAITAKALSVSVVETVMGPEYTGELVVGVVPLVV